MPKISNTWDLIIDKDGNKNTVKHDFHIKCKDRWRDMINADPDATGNSLQLLKFLIFDSSIAYRDKNEKPQPNEVFFEQMLDDYNKKYKQYKPGLVERAIKTKVENFIRALFHNDSAYYERICGIISYIIINKDKFKGQNVDHYTELHNVYLWWAKNDHRKRTWGWIDWVFRYTLNKYQIDMFYKKSINHMLEFIIINAEHWKILPTYYPERWFGSIRGAQIIALYGGNF